MFDAIGLKDLHQVPGVDSLINNLKTKASDAVKKQIDALRQKDLVSPSDNLVLPFQAGLAVGEALGFTWLLLNFGFDPPTMPIHTTPITALTTPNEATAAVTMPANSPGGPVNGSVAAASLAVAGQVSADWATTGVIPNRMDS